MCAKISMKGYFIVVIATTIRYSEAKRMNIIFLHINTV